MAKEDFTQLSSDLLEQKLTKAKTTVRFITASMIAMVIIALIMLWLNPLISSFAGFVAVLSPLVVIQNQKAKSIEAELSKRKG